MPDVEELTPAAAENLPAEPAAASETAPVEDEQEIKPKGGFQRKIDKLTRERYELRERIANLEGRLATQPAATTSKEADNDPKPDPNTWTGNADEYLAAMARWEARQEYRQLTKKERETAETTEREERDREVLQGYRDRAVEFSNDHDDFNEVINRANLAKDIAGPVQVAIMEDENGPELAYHLGQHPEICAKLNDLTPAGAVKYLGRLSERLFPETSEEEEEEVAEVASPKPQPKRLPTPITPTRKTAATDRGLSDSLSAEEWHKRFRKQMGYD